MNLAEVYSTGLEMSMWSSSGQYDFEVFELHYLLVLISTNFKNI